jgi:hypothetical protein
VCSAHAPCCIVICDLSGCTTIFNIISQKYNCGKNVINLIFMDPCIVDDSVEISTRWSFVIEFIIP